MKSINMTLCVVLAMVLIGGIGLYVFFLSEPESSPISGDTPHNTAPVDAQHATYIIDGTAVTLVNGVSVRDTAPGSASKITTQYFGNDVSLDLDNDGVADHVFLITQNTGGTGTFYYVTGTLVRDGQHQGLNAVFIGDRIAPQSTVVNDGRSVSVHYADRLAHENFATPPSVGKTATVRFNIETRKLEIIP